MSWRPRRLFFYKSSITSYYLNDLMYVLSGTIIKELKIELNQIPVID